jgi:hypothetical protein
MLIEEFFAFQHHALGRFQHRIESAQYGKRQYHIAIFAAHIHIAQTVIGDVPDEVCNPFELALIHIIIVIPRCLPDQSLSSD